MKRSFSYVLIAAAISGCTALPTTTTVSTLSDSEVTLDEGYTYPKPQQVEVVETLVNQTQALPYQVRVQVATSILEMGSQRPYFPNMVPVIEGDDSKTLVLVDLGDANIDSVYKARAMVSAVTSLMRNNPLFLEYGVESDATMFDMLKIWGFERLIVTNAKDFSHEFQIK